MVKYICIFYNDKKFKACQKNSVIKIKFACDIIFKNENFCRKPMMSTMATFYIKRTCVPGSPCCLGPTAVCLAPS